MQHKQMIFIASLSLLIAATFTIRYFAKLNPRALTPPPVDQVLEEDRRNLEGKVGANEYQIYAALVRLANANDEFALKQARARQTDPSEWIRAGAAEALGHSHDSDDLKTLIAMTTDKSTMVKQKALRAFAYDLESKERLSWIESLLDRSDLSGSERVQALRSAILLSPPARREHYVRKLVEVAKSLSGNPEIDAWLELASIAPRDAAVVNSFEAMAKDATTNEDLQALAIRHLAAVSPASVRARFFGLHKDKRAKVRAAVAQSLPIACPLERTAILRDVFEKEKESIVWRLAVQTSAGMPSAQVLELLKAADKRPHSADDGFYLTRSIEVLEKLLAEKVKDPCDALVPGRKSAAQ